MPSMHVCGRCDAFMRVALNGVRVREMKENGRPYRVWAADLWRCPICGWELVTGFGNGPLAHYGTEAYQPYIDAAGKRGELVTAYHIKQPRKEERDEEDMGCPLCALGESRSCSLYQEWARRQTLSRRSSAFH